MDLAHRVGVSHITRAPIFSTAGVALRQRVYKRLLARRSFWPERNRFLNYLERFRFGSGIHGRINVRTQRQRFSPVSNR